MLKQCPGILWLTPGFQTRGQVDLVKLAHLDGAPNLVYTVTLNQASFSALSINYTIGGTATNGTDYATIASPLVSPAGNTTGAVTVNPTADATIEANETATLTLAVMTRASLGHTGREIRADRWTVAIYLAVTASAILRVASPYLASRYMETLTVAGTLWTLAFALFVIRYAPILATRRR